MARVRVLPAAEIQDADLAAMARASGDEMYGVFGHCPEAFKRAHFADDELVELGLVTAAFLMPGRLHRTFDVAPMTEASHAVLRPGRA